ncbi:unnamed protein product [Ambrosiozyma monospora]|uniref:Unnamed protein product n=1 Tax=Ambrosiozyma monospora TaxID=43982 RepID=A0A9W6Z665_AMBMO|nr:unnamed protein product [Ambrosiozyma monospora]
MPSLRTLCFIASLLVSGSQARDSSIGCYISSDLSPGFDVKLYDYTFNDTIHYTDPGFYGGGYSSNKLLGTTDGIIDPDFYITGPRTPYSGEVYGIPIHASNFAAELTGYFTPTKNGMYTFSLDSIDDGAMVWLGDSAFDCCNPDDQTPDNSGASIMFITKPFDKDARSITASVYLQEGFQFS